MLEFIGSPLWKTSVSSFIDVFCTQFKDQEENKLEHIRIHQEFKEIVEDLLEEHMEK